MKILSKIISLKVGAVIGIGLGMLFAQRKGTDLRRDIDTEFHKGGIQSAAKVAAKAGKKACDDFLSTISKFTEQCEGKNKCNTAAEVIKPKKVVREKPTAQKTTTKKTITRKTPAKKPAKTTT